MPEINHIPVLVDEILSLLEPTGPEIVVDCTLGFGGHTLAVLERFPRAKVVALDQDQSAIDAARNRLTNYSERVEFVHANFSYIETVLNNLSINKVDSVIADLGVSSMQIDNPARGFTFKREGPLDLRMNPEKGAPASALLATISEEKLTALLQENADEPAAERIAQALCARRDTLTTTTALATAVRNALGAEAGDDPVRRTFQALRIADNQEFSALDTLLHVLPYCLNPGGRVAILTFHSGEDRRVKRAFQHGHERGEYAAIADTVLRPSAEERYRNPRSSSAKLRWAVQGDTD
jgi:16S rRNA (cytosine1402-N4)-methyltransferase